MKWIFKTCPMVFKSGPAVLLALAGCSSEAPARVLEHPDAATGAAQDALSEPDAGQGPEAGPDAPESGQGEAETGAEAGCNWGCENIGAQCGAVAPSDPFCTAGLCCGPCPAGSRCVDGNQCAPLDGCCLISQPGCKPEGPCTMLQDGKHYCGADAAAPLCPWDDAWQCYDCTAEC